MDTQPEVEFGVEDEINIPLNYDEPLPPIDEEVIPAAVDSAPSLANRIGHTKVYLISEAAGPSRLGKRKHDNDAEEEAEEEIAEDSDSFHRENAILFQGSPISHLPTENIFEYATELKARPIALEWIDDSTCILVFSSRNAARNAHKSLMKFPSEEPSEEGFITSKPIPIALWPPEDRINKSLGMSEGLKGIIRMRWATKLDVKKKGAKQQSQFYKKYGRGRDEQDATGPAQKKRRGEGGEVSDVLEKAQLDDDLDAFLAEGEEKQLSSKPAESKMRSDYIAADGRTLLERTSDIRVHSGDLESRIGPSRRRRDAGGSKGSLSDRLTEGGHQKSRGRGREGRGREKRSRTERPRKTQEDLDAELDAFLNGRD